MNAAAAETKHTPWPTHPDGRNKRMGEMTLDEQREQIRASCGRLKAEIESPEFAAAIAKAEGR